MPLGVSLTKHLTRGKILRFRHQDVFPCVKAFEFSVIAVYFEDQIARFRVNQISRQGIGEVSHMRLRIVGLHCRLILRMTLSN